MKLNFMYLTNYSESSEWIKKLPTYVCYAGKVTVLKTSGLDPVYDQSPSGARFATFFRFFDGKTIPIQIGVHYTAKYEFDDIKNIYSYYTDPGDSENGINPRIHRLV